MLHSRERISLINIESTQIFWKVMDFLFRNCSLIRCSTQDKVCSNINCHTIATMTLIFHSHVHLDPHGLYPNDAFNALI